jgi:nucleotide-binding universal stress UspA family protein
MTATTQTFPEPLTQGKLIFERILVLIDFGVSPRATLGVALELHRTLGSKVCLYTVPELTGGDEFLAGLGSPSVIMADLGEEARGRLHRFLENVAPEFAPEVELRARVDVDPIASLREEALRWGATLVIAAADSHAGIFLRSRAEKLVHAFDIPVLLVPAPRPRRV